LKVFDTLAKRLNFQKAVNELNNTEQLFMIYFEIIKNATLQQKLFQIKLS
jgi:hypothetical protein